MPRRPRKWGFVSCLFFVACRDTVEPFSSRDQPGLGDPPLQLTFSAGDDRSPAWSSQSDTIYYSASESDVGESDGVLMAVALKGGAAHPLLPSQLGRSIPPRLVEPSFHSPTDHLAFVEISPTHAVGACATPFIECGVSTGVRSPELNEAWLTVDDGNETEDWTRLLRLRFHGGAEETLERIDQLTVFISRYTPHQANWLQDRSLPLKPSFNPEGDFIAIADDDGLHVVSLNSAEMRTLLSGDISNPAWSPDGEWIAFDRVERTDSVPDLCLYSAPDPKSPGQLIGICYERRVFYDAGPPVVWLVRPQGGEEQAVADGLDPAWGPAGGTLYFVGREGIIRYDLATRNTMLVPGTEGGAEPAISPDGRWLAFTRFDTADHGRNVWVVAAR